MSIPKVIRTDNEHEAALHEFDRLAALNPQPGTHERDTLDLLVLLITDYESRQWPPQLPDPITAIEFRMEQQGLAPRDLIAFLGSRSKVSEVLARRRPLSLQQIRALHEGLGIPAEILIQKPDPATNTQAVDWSRFPAREMAKRGWLNDDAPPTLQAWFSGIVGAPALLASARFRTSTVRGKRIMDEYALVAWAARVAERAHAQLLPHYTPGSLTSNVMADLVRLSREPRGVRLVFDHLRALGIAVVIERHLPRTHLDGGALLLAPGAAPIVGLTLRYDRLDNFWFTLMHELAHIVLHLEGRDNGVYYDDLEQNVHISEQELEADRLARDTLIPPAAWEASGARRYVSAIEAETLAEQLGISPAIVAGRMRYEHRDWRALTNLIGYHGVSAQLTPF